MQRVWKGSRLAVLACAWQAAAAQHVDEEIQVRGVPIAAEASQLAQPVTVLGGEALERVRGASLGETLAGTLGVSSSYFSAGASRPVVRGLAGARVRTLEDGIDSLDISTLSADHAVSIDPLVAEQIEIFRGPTSLLYGSGAVGGVVNTITRRIPEDLPEGGFNGAVELRADSAADERSAALRLDGGRDVFAWHFDALDRGTKDYRIPGQAALRQGGEPDSARPGVLENSAVDTSSAAFGASWLGPNGFAGAAFSTFDTSYGVPGHHHDAEESPVRIDLEQTRLDVKAGWLGGPTIEAVNVRVGANDYRHVELEGEVSNTRFSNDAWEARVEVIHAPFGRWHGAFGVQLGERRFAAIGAEAFVPPVDTATYGAFLLERLDLESWRVELGGRVERRRHDPASGGPVNEANATSLSFAALREIGGGRTLAFSAALAERLPVAEELYASGPHLASRTIEIGDPSLGSEASRHIDASIRKGTGTLKWSVTAFLTSYRDFIFLRDTGAVDSLEGLPIFRYAQHDADFWGYELELFTPVAEPGAGELDLRLFADYVEGELDGGGYLPQLPPLRYGARLQYHDERLTAGLEATRHGDQTKTAAFEEPTDGYTMINADVRLVLPAARWELFLRGTNLSDAEARKHTSLVKDVAPLPGRNYTLGVRGRF